MSLDERQQLQYALADAAAADKDYHLTPVGVGEWEIEDVVFTPSGDGAVAINGTDYRTLTVTAGGDAVASVTTNTGGTAFVAGTPISMTVTSRFLTAKTDPVKVASVHTGATGKVANGHLIVGLRKVRA